MPAPAPTPTAPPPDQSAAIAALQAQVAELQAQVTGLNAPVFAKYRAWESASYDEKIRLLTHRAKMYEGQDFSGAVMMWMSFAVVIVGLALSAAQLIVAMRVGRKDDGTIDLSMTGLKVTSSVTGLLILAMSLGFTYVFIDKVYTIHDVQVAEGKAPVKLPDQPSGAH